MGGIIACLCCYCCLTTLKPKSIEIIALLCNIISIGFLIWGIADIPWDDISTAGKIFFYITCGCVVLTLIFLLGLMCIRCSGKINTSKNSSAKCLCITLMVFDILAFILIIISEIIIFYNMDDKDDDYYYYDYYYGRRRRSKYSNREWAASIISISVAELAIMCHSYCANFLYKLISAKTDTSYLDCMEQRENSNNIVTRTINVLNQPTNNNTNQLTFIGYDKDGHPIYSGKNQYFTATNTNVNTNGK